jgi:tetratricopeptide (TPR) repeat protein
LDYENVVLALLAEVALGKTWGQLQAFLISRNVNKERLAEWLQEFGQRWLTQPESHRELARRLVLLGERATGELGIVAKTLGERLLVSSNRDSSLESVMLESGEGEATLIEVQKLNQLLAALDTSGNNQEPISKSNSWTAQDANFWIEQGNALSRLGRYEEAVDSFDQALALRPDDYEALLNRGADLNELGRYEEALASFHQAIQLQPEFHLTWYNQGIVQKRLGSYKEAVASFDQAIQLQPEFHLTWYNQGIVQSLLGNYEEAITSFDQAVKLQPNFYDAWNSRGNALRDLERYEEAVTSYDRGLQLQPNFHHSWHKRGFVLLENLRRYEEAIASFDQAIQLQPDYYFDWYGRGVALENLRRYEEALASFDQALQLQPDYDNAWNSRGLTLFRLGRYEEALASGDQAISLQPNSHLSWLNRSNSLGNLERYEEAVASLDQALALQPDFHYAWMNRGLAAKSSSGYEPFLQQQFSACFRLEVSKSPQRLIPAFEAIDYNQRLKQFLTSLNASKALLSERFAHLPNVIAQIQQPPPPKLSQFIRQSSPQKLIEFIQQQRLSEAVVAQIEQASCLHPSQRNPQLNQRGYPGTIASYQAELDKAIRRDTHPEGWGVLHHRTGIAHYYHGQKVANPHSFWRKAETSYKTALQTLKPPEFEELHLEVLQDLIRVLLDLREREEAAELQRRGADLLQRMLADPKRTETPEATTRP